MDSKYLDDMMKDCNIHTPITPEEQIILDKLNVSTKQTIENGIEPQEINNMQILTCLLITKGLTMDELKNNMLLIFTLGFDSDFSTTDSNVDKILTIIKSQ